MSHTPDTQHTPAGRGGKSQRDFRRHGARYRARRRAVDILFEAEARDVDPVAIVEDRVELARQPDAAVAPIADYTRTIISGAAEELDGIDETIERYLSVDWELHRLPAVDRAILRVAVWELLHNPDVPKATAVVEGVELASEYSNNVAPPYIHAVLDDVAQSSAEDNPFQASTPAADAEPEPEAEPADVAELPEAPEPPQVADESPQPVDADPADVPELPEGESRT